jgi:transcriptional regulator with XRE-family HTH domain
VLLIVMTNDKLKEIGKRIRAEREKYSLSREKFSELVNISPRYLSGIELGRKQMSLDTAVAVARSLHIKLDYLILGDSEPAADAEPIIELLRKCSKRELSMASDVLKIFLMKKDE